MLIFNEKHAKLYLCKNLAISSEITAVSLTFNVVLTLSGPRNEPINFFQSLSNTFAIN